MRDSVQTRRGWLRSFFAVALAGWWCSGGAAVGLTDEPEPDEEKEDDEEEIEVAKVPAKVRQAAAKAVKGAKWEAAFRLKNEDGEHYELEGIDSKGRGVVVTVSPDGVVDEIETEIRPKDLPDAVTKAVREKMPSFKAHAATEITENGKVSGYEIEGRRPKDKRDILVSVSPDGKTVEIDEAFAVEKGEKGQKKGKSEQPKDKKRKKQVDSS